MIIKIAIKNVKYNIKDYIIYVFALIISITTFYSFLSITSSKFSANLPSEFDLTQLKVLVNQLLLIVSCINIYLINYAQNYIIKKRYREISIQQLMGVSTMHIAKLILLETFFLGILSLIVAIFMGTFLSQIVIKILLTSFGVNYVFSFILFPDIIVKTCLFFISIFIVVGSLVSFKCNELSIIDKMNYTDVVENRGRKNFKYKEKVILATLVLESLLLLYIAFATSRNSNLMYIIIFSIIALVVECLLLNYSKKNESLSFNLKIGILSFISFAGSIMINFEIASYSIDIVNTMTKTILSYMIVFNCIYFISVCYSTLLSYLNYKRIHKKEYVYKENNILYVGQLVSQINRNKMTLIVISIMMIATIASVVIGDILGKWSLGLNDSKSSADFEISTNYNDVRYYEDMLFISPKELFEEGFFDSFFIEENNGVIVSLYYLDESDFKKRRKDSFPTLCVYIDDYNKLRKKLDLPPYILDDDKYAIHASLRLSEYDIERLKKESSVLSLNGEKLFLSNEIEKHNIGNRIFNKYTDKIIILPNSDLEDLKYAGYNYYYFSDDSIAYEVASQVQSQLAKKFKEHYDTYKVSMESRFKTLDDNSSISTALSIKLLLLYFAMLLIIVALTILSIEEIDDSLKMQRQFYSIYRMGTSKKEIEALLKKQIRFWFSLPLSIGLLLGIFILIYIGYFYRLELSVYIGLRSILQTISFTIGIIIFALSVFYYLCLYIVKKNIFNKF